MFPLKPFFVGDIYFKNKKTACIGDVPIKTYIL